MRCFWIFVTLLSGFSALDAQTLRWVVLGDSLTAGYGLEPAHAFPALLEDRIRSAGIDAEVVNAGISGDTTAGGLSRVQWLTRRPIDGLVLALGANDALRGFDLATTRGNLEKIIQSVRAHNPDCRIILAGMQAPPNMGRPYQKAFAGIFVELAREYSLPLIPFLLEGVAGQPALNLEDGIHPNRKGHTIVAENVWRVLKGELVEQKR